MATLAVDDDEDGDDVDVIHRVKELGPGGTGDSKYDYPTSSEMSPQKSDLALLRNINVSRGWCC